MRSRFFRLVFPVCLLIAVLGPARAQDLSTFLSEPPEPGAWVKYEITTHKSEGPKVKPLELSITGSSVVNQQPYIWLEVWPYKFQGRSDGTLQMLVKAEPTKEEALNPFLQALSVAYGDPGDEAFKLSEGALNLLHSQAEEVRLTQEITEEGWEDLVLPGGATCRCRKQKRVTIMATSFFTKKVETTEEGFYWFSEEVPFGLVKAEITRVEKKKEREKTKKISVNLTEWAFSGAESRFESPPEKEKGVLGLLFH